jgi:hypothetical protein
MMDDKSIYVELVRGNIDMDHFSRTPAYGLKLNSDMVILVGESVDEGWFNEQKKIYDVLGAKDGLGIDLGMRVVEFFEKGGININNEYGNCYRDLSKVNKPKNKANVDTIADLHNRKLFTISRKYKDKYYKASIVDDGTIEYKGNKLYSYDQLYKAVTPKTNSHYEGDGIYVWEELSTNKGEWTRLLDL